MLSSVSKYTYILFFIVIPVQMELKAAHTALESERGTLVVSNVNSPTQKDTTETTPVKRGPGRPRKQLTPEGLTVEKKQCPLAGKEQIKTIDTKTPQKRTARKAVSSSVVSNITIAKSQESSSKPVSSTDKTEAMVVSAGRIKRTARKSMLYSARQKVANTDVDIATKNELLEMWETDTVDKEISMQVKDGDNGVDAVNDDDPEINFQYKGTSAVSETSTKIGKFSGMDTELVISKDFTKPVSRGRKPGCRKGLLVIDGLSGTDDTESEMDSVASDDEKPHRPRRYRRKPDRLSDAESKSKDSDTESKQPLEVTLVGGRGRQVKQPSAESERPSLEVTIMKGYERQVKSLTKKPLEIRDSPGKSSGVVVNDSNTDNVMIETNNVDETSVTVKKDVSVVNKSGIPESRVKSGLVAEGEDIVNNITEADALVSEQESIVHVTEETLVSVPAKRTAGRPKKTPDQDILPKSLPVKPSTKPTTRTRFQISMFVIENIITIMTPFRVFC